MSFFGLFKLIALWIPIGLIAFPSIGRCVLLDRFVATVNEQVILESEIRIEKAFGESGFSSEPRAADHVSRKELIDRLINHRLLLSESARFRDTVQTSERIDLAVREVIERVGGEARANQLLQQIGLSRNELRRRIQDQLALEEYVNQRIRAFIQVHSSDIEQYLVDHREQLKLTATTPEELMSEAPEELIERITVLLREERVNERLELQVKSLYEAAEILILQPDE